ncbi:MAG TPA: hypothetical protein PK542_05920 [Treponemataceae bacterium]|nr:hypothetical protein [Treponemataceae bacterium]HPS44005.1 hypothetical protein [Treponemataceae bacterium]
MKKKNLACQNVIATCLIIFFIALLSGCLPRSKHPGPMGEELSLGADFGQSPTDARATTIQK